MLTEKRTIEPGVIQRLLDEPYRFQFFQAVRVLEIWVKNNGFTPENSVEDHLRFQNRTSLSFPASEIENLDLFPPEIPKNAKDIAEALKNGELEHIAMIPTFMGFLGSNGALPAHYTERIADHILYERDASPKAFLDTFSNRALALFYKAWTKYRLEFKYEADGRDQFLPLLLSVAGLGNSALQKRLSVNNEGVFDQSLGFYAAALSQRPASAAYIEQVLADYFALNINIEQFIGHWYTVPTNQQTVLGATNATLGSSALAGARVWQRDLRMRVIIGPMDRKDFESFLPGGKSAQSLEKILTLFTNVCLEYEIQLILAKKEVQGMSLTPDLDKGRLGWDSFLMTEAAECDRGDVRYEIHAL